MFQGVEKWWTKKKRVNGRKGEKSGGDDILWRGIPVWKKTESKISTLVMFGIRMRVILKKFVPKTAL